MDNSGAAQASTPKPATSAGSPATPNGTNMIDVLQNLLKNQTGEQMSNEKVAQLLISNMSTLIKAGKLNETQILQLKAFADKHKGGGLTGAQPAAGPSRAPGTSTPAPTPVNPAFKSSAQDSAPTLASLTSSPSDQAYPISATLGTTNPGAVQWPAARPTLSGGYTAGRLVGTPAQTARPDDATMLTLEDNRSRRKSTPGDQSMRRSIQELVASIDPNVKIEPEVEDLLLSIADEFIDSVTNFSCRLAKHRGGDTLEVRDLQLHLERNHNIRIPGFASDDTRISLSQSSVAPVAQAPPPKKAAPGTHMTLRSQRLQQVQLAKREGKLL
ncbi:transcription initiation factor tfiid subunit 12 [Moniliophthora roreri MCA 2997]|uniref:TBP-associated factor 12 n=2 Tax=Moniliophthora roreri TaxID=221103 RepID=V2XRK1_MONRO|nr:transcription initiation factor tfiid subunit 12 [Moniliophthora roreri MCA 2997]KAI3616488.1 transcription initiation factor tfiid subunit 12 [Moniliophthora roreri]